MIDRQPVAQLNRKPPVRRLMQADGTVIEEKVPALPSRKIVTPSGGVVYVPYVTGRTLGGHNDTSEGSSYWRQKWAEKKAKGNLLYAECPYANGSMPTPDGVEPCKGKHPMEQQVVNELYDHRKPISQRNQPMRTVVLSERGAFWKLNPNAPRYYVEDECCPHMEAIIAARKEKQAKRQAEYAAAFKKPDQVYYESKLAEMAKANETPDAEQRNPRRKRVTVTAPTDEVGE